MSIASNSRAHNRRVTVVVLLLVLAACMPSLGSCAAGMDNTVNVSILVTSETLLSGLFTSCDPSPNVSSCVGGLASVAALARTHALSTNGTVLLLPLVDTTSDITRLHNHKAGVNLLMYSRIRTSYTQDGTNVNMLGYRVSPDTLANRGDALDRLLRDPTFKPLASSFAIPPSSAWRFVVDIARVIDLDTMASSDMASTVGSESSEGSSSKIGLLQIEAGGQVWSTSALATPLKFGTRVNATHLIDSADADTYSMSRAVASVTTVVRSRVGFVILLSDDTTIPYVTLLEDMLALEIENEFLEAVDAARDETPTQATLSHVPDVLYQIGGSSDTAPSPIDIHATYVSANGTVISKTRQVVVAEMVSRRTAAINLQLNRTAVAAAANKAAGSVLPTSMLVMPATTTAFTTALTDSQKDAKYFADQAELLVYSREAAANDAVIGSIAEAIPQLEAGPTTFTCYAGECAQGTLSTRSLLWRLGADVAMIASGSFTPSHPINSGNMSLSETFAVYPTADLPCRAVMTGLRLWRLVSFAVSQSRFTTADSPTAASLLQMSGVKVEYAIQPSGYGKLVNLLVYNATTAMYEEIQRLRYYTVATTENVCLYQPDIHEFFDEASLYRGESVQSVYSQQLVPEMIAAYLPTHSPYPSAYANYYASVPLSDLTNGARSYLTFATGVDSCTATQRYDEGVATCFDCEGGFERSAVNESECSLIPVPADNTPLIVGLAVGGGVLLMAVVAVAVFCEYKRRSGSRSNGNAPRGGDVAVIFTDIKSSTKLWGAVPMSMGVSLDAHHALIREAIGEHRGYEVKTVGDSFMIAIGSAQGAVDLAVSIQNKLYNHKWPSAIDGVYQCTTDELDVDDDPDDCVGPEAGEPWNGIRVRVGINYGPVEVVFDEVTKGYDYYGPTVNVAARVEGVTDGGQLCVSAALMGAVQATTATYQSVLLAKTTLRGVKDEMEVYEIRPTGLATRKFDNPLIFNEDAKAAQDVENESSISTMNTKGSRSSQVFVPLTNHTRPIRDSIREAFKALRGADRVQVMERVRKAWRVELPSGKAFKGLSEAQIAEKQRRSGKKKVSHRKSKSNGGSPPLEGTRRKSNNSGGTLGSLQLAAVVSVCDNTTASSMHSDTQEDEEDDEDIIFRVVAQRVAPAIKKKFAPSAIATEDGGGYNNATVDKDSKVPLSPSMTSAYRLDNIIVTDHVLDGTPDDKQHHRPRSVSKGNSPHRSAFVRQSPLTPAVGTRVEFATYSSNQSSSSRGGTHPPAGGGADAPRNRSLSSFPVMGAAMNSTSTTIAQLIELKSVGSSTALEQQHQQQHPQDQK